MKLHKHPVSGVALVIVLGFLVIISALAVAFFSSVSTELKASRTFAAGVTTRQLADSAVQLVMGQIAAATTRGVDVNGNGQGNEAWASQPGMIRVYGSNLGSASTASASADAFFKLYSSNQMILTAQSGLAGFKTGVYTDPAQDSYNGWDSAPALWTDLNAPVLVRDPVNPTAPPTPRFPIIDPRAYTHAVSTSTAWTDTKWQNTVEGFTYDETAVHGAVGAGAGDLQRLPMPVRWIYVLQDGTLTTPNTNGTVVATFTTNAPTAQNPIVGRIAFWTDDETCKLNLNTCAGFTANLSSLNSAYQNSPSTFAGSFWDTPRFYTQFDYGIPDSTGNPQQNQTSGGLALCQLLQNEFQRYPGHPATTSLAPVLNNLLTSEQLYAIVPRYSNLNLQGNPSSTVGGTQRIIVDPVNTPGDLDNKELQPKQDRLFASVDELIFGPKVKTGNFSNPSYARVTVNNYNQFPGNPITTDLIDKLRFFVTAQSRAPELNLYGQPRVTVWPVRSETSTEVTGLNVFDNLILFCSTVGSGGATGARPDTKNITPGVYRYIFTRREVATTMTSATSHSDPVTGGPVTSQYEFNSGYTPDCEILRNSQLLSNYLGGTQGLLSRPTPGFGLPFVGNTRNYTLADEQQILTEIFDYVRLANSQDTTTTISTGTAIQFAPRGYVPPSKPTYFTTPNQAKGFGRMSTLCEAALVFYYAGPQMDTAFSPPSGFAPNTGWSKWDPAAPNSRYAKTTVDASGNPKISGGYMRAFMLFSTFDPMQGYAPKTDPAQTDPKLSIEVKWPQDWNVVIPGGYSGPMGWPVTPSQGVTTTIYRAPGAYWGGRNYGGFEGFMHTLQGSGLAWAPYKCKWDNASAAASSFLTAADYGETYNPSAPGSPIKNLFFPATAVSSAGANITPSSSTQEYYPFQTVASKAMAIPGPATNLNPTFNFTGGNMTVILYYGGSNSGSTTSSKALQTINMNFPAGLGWPVPQGPPQVLNKMVANQAVKPPTADVTTWAAMDGTASWFGTTPTVASQGSLMRTWYWTGNGAFFANMAVGVRTAKLGVFSYKTSLQASWSLATRIAWCTVGDSAGPGIGGISWDPYTNSSGSPIAPGYFGDRWRCIVQPGDTIRSLLYWNGKNASGSPLAGKQAISSGDLRLAAASSTIANTDFAPHPDYNGPSGSNGYQSRACVLRGGDGNLYFPVTNSNTSAGGALATAPANVPIGGADATKEAVLGNHVALTSQASPPFFPVFPQTRAFANLPWSGGANPKGMVNGVVRGAGGGSYPGDFDNGAGDFPDGPFCNKQDEGNVIYRYLDYNGIYIYPIPYFTSNWSYQKPGNTFTSPSRQMPSAGMLGSLPSQVPEGFGWQTLSFSPVPAGDAHPGNQFPKDHLLLDLFMMPVVEPYPISEPFSTAGKVNLNYRIVPFDYIRRSTALRGALYPLRVTVVDSQGKGPSLGTGTQFLTYKTGQIQVSGNTIQALNGPNGNPMPISANFRKQLDRDLTIQGFDGFYDYYVGHPDDGFFKSASQVCERYLYPKGDFSSYGGFTGEATAMRAYWDSHGDLTGDNEREKPYTDLYPRVTTKSNTFTVHMRVQTLRQAPRGPGQSYGTWMEGKDNVLGEYRGSSTIERYVDPADPRFSPTSPNAPPLNPDTQSVEPLYHFRVVINKKFTQ